MMHDDIMFSRLRVYLVRLALEDPA
jgi:hypothetical protein